MKIKNLFKIAIINILCINFAFANTIFSVPENTQVSKNSIVNIKVYLQADQKLNAIEGVIKIPKNIRVKNINDGDSAITMWVDKPEVNAVGNIKFSGITPGGVMGKINLFNFTVDLKENGEYTFDFNEVKVYLNDGNGTQALLDKKTQKISVADQYKSIVYNFEDVTPPHDFDISVVSDPLINEGKFSAIFNTNDDGVGIQKYEINESRSIRKENNFIYPKNKEWREVTSPALLNDQKLKSHIFVRAIDKNGNEMVAYLAPKNKNNYLPVIISVMLLLLLCYYRYNKRK
jgi:hypothetical protein